jgi:hypothetical protein
MHTQALLLLGTIALTVGSAFAEQAETRAANAAEPAVTGSANRSAAPAMPGDSAAKDEAVQIRPGSKKERIRYTIPPGKTKRM